MDSFECGIQDELDVGRVRAGDDEAFGLLVQRNFGRVYTDAFARLRDRDAAEELTQEVFIRAYLGLATLRESRTFAAWCAGIARNLAVDWSRSRNRQSKVLTMIPIDEVPAENLKDRTQSPRDLVAKQEEERRLEAALEQLPVPLRETVMLHYSEGLTKSEIARTLGINRSLAGRQLERAVELWREQLGSSLPETSAALLPRPESLRQAVLAATAVAAMSPETKAALAAAAGEAAGSVHDTPRTRVVKSPAVGAPGGVALGMLAVVLAGAIIVAVTLRFRDTAFGVVQGSPAPVRTRVNPVPSEVSPRPSRPATARLKDRRFLSREGRGANPSSGSAAMNGPAETRFPASG